jgi:hypothetical protein
MVGPRCPTARSTTTQTASTPACTSFARSERPSHLQCDYVGPGAKAPGFLFSVTQRCRRHLLRGRKLASVFERPCHAGANVGYDASFAETCPSAIGQVQLLATGQRMALMGRHGSSKFPVSSIGRPRVSADARRLLHDHEPGAVHVFRQALGDDARHDVVSVVCTHLAPSPFTPSFQDSAERLFCPRPNGVDAGDLDF